MMERKRTPWTPEEAKAVVSLRGQGLSWAEIPTRLHEMGHPLRSAASVRAALRNNRRFQAFINDDDTYRGNDHWGEEEVKAALELRAQGHIWADLPDLLAEKGFPRRSSKDAIRSAFRSNHLFRSLAFGDDTYLETRGARIQSSLDAGKQVVTHRIQANRPWTEEEFADLFGVDLERWKPGKLKTNQWANSFQTTLEYTPNEEGAVASEKWGELLSLVRERAPRHPAVEMPSTGVLYMIEMTDIHLGMRSWWKETGTDWDLTIAMREAKRAFFDLLSQLPPGTEKILLRVGDDLLHYDKLDGGKVPSTFKGTPQDVDSRYPKMFAAAANLTVDWILEALRSVPNVWVVMMPGNHDTHSIYALGELLKARFHADERVRIDNTPLDRKYIRWGDNLIGMAHGGSPGLFKRLPDLMKTEARVEWGETTYAEWHTGDKHHEYTKDEGGKMVVVRILRALCPNDHWHTEEGYASYRGAQAFAYRKDIPGTWKVNYYLAPHSYETLASQGNATVFREET